MGMPLQATANRSFSNRGSELSFNDKTSSNGNVPLPPSHAVGERDLASKNNGTVSKLITVQDGLSGSPQYQLLVQHDTVVSQNHLSEIPTLPINESQLRYHDCNYLQRKVVTKNQAKAYQEGEIIPLLEKTGYACNTAYVVRQDPVFKQRAKPNSPSRFAGANSLDQVSLPELVKSPNTLRAKRESTIIDQKALKSDNDSTMGQYASIMAKAAEKGKGGFNVFDYRRATEVAPVSNH